MNILRKNNLIKKIAIIILFIMCFNMLIPTTSVQAVAFLDGGDLLQPIMDFLVYLADAVLNVLQHNFISMKDVVISPTGGDTNWWGALGWTGFALLGIVAITYGIATIATGGGIIIGTVIAAGAIYGTVYCAGNAWDCLEGEFDLPFIAYHPYTIFSGRVPALDINFIEPMGGRVEKVLDSKSEFQIELLFSGEYEYELEHVKELYDLMNGSGDAWHIINHATPTDNIHHIGLTQEVFSKALKIIVYDDGNDYSEKDDFSDFLYLNRKELFSDVEKENIRKLVENLNHYDGEDTSFEFLIIWEDTGSLNVLEIVDTSR